MLHELEHTISERGMKLEDYMASIKKTKDELRIDFVPQAMRRIRAATLIKEIAKRESINVTDNEVDTEVDHILQGTPKDDKETRERVISPEYREYLAVMMRNQKAIVLLREKGIKNYPKHKESPEHVHGPDCDHGDSD
jgi:trigger factor